MNSKTASPLQNQATYELSKTLKQAAGKVLIPLTKQYLKSERQFTYESLVMKVYPGVFHPGMFVGTKFLLSYLKTQNLQNQTFLDVGTGSGALALYGAKQGAKVTAIDINPNAIENAIANAKANNLTLDCIQSDLFDNVPTQPFDFIAINPPYYPQEAKDDAELAWYCGAGFEYYHKLFDQLKSYIHKDTTIAMVMTKSDHLAKIKEIGTSHNFSFTIAKEKNVLFDEKNFIFLIEYQQFK